MKRERNKQMAKLKKIGAVWEAKDSTPETPKYFLKLGQKNEKKPQYDLTVEVTVKDNNGKVVAQTTDGFLTLSDPRRSPVLDENQKAKLPQKLQFEVLVGDND